MSEFLVTIPEWNSDYVLPPLRATPDSRLPQSRRPHKATALEVVHRFAISKERSSILFGFLDYRLALHDLGIVDGFQWVNGSFVENIEARNSQHPRDIDVVTFYHPPEDHDNRHLRLFDPEQMLLEYHVDARGVRLGLPMTPERVETVSYWHSMWTHRKDGLWKGMVEVDLDPKDDEAALQTLTSLMEGRGWQ